MDINRKTAYQVLADIEKKKSYSNISLNHHIIINKPNNQTFVKRYPGWYEGYNSFDPVTPLFYCSMLNSFGNSVNSEIGTSGFGSGGDFGGFGGDGFGGGGFSGGGFGGGGGGAW